MSLESCFRILDFRTQPQAAPIAADAILPRILQEANFTPALGALAPMMSGNIFTVSLAEYAHGKPGDIRAPARGIPAESGSKAARSGETESAPLPTQGGVAEAGRKRFVAWKTLPWPMP